MTLFLMLVSLYWVGPKDHAHPMLFQLEDRLSGHALAWLDEITDL
jgi:hypothetical protein